MTKIVKNIEEAKAILGLGETKAANDTSNTENTGHGEELVPSEEFASSVYEEIVKNSALLSMLPGNHGSNLPKNLIVPVIGEFGFFANAPEYTDSAVTPMNNKLMNTAEIELKRSKFIMTIPVSDELLAGGIDVERYIRGNLAGAGARTSEATIINADNTTGTANINDKGNTVSAGDSRYWFRPAGLRKTGIANTARDIGALTASDLFDLAGDLGEKGTNPADCLFITNRQTALKISQITELINAYASGRTSTIAKGAETNLLGSDVYIARDIALTGTDGLVDGTTPANNTKGSILYLNKNAPQFGFSDLKIEVKRIEGYGYHFVATYYFAHAIANKLAGQTSPSVVLGRNVTL